MHLLHTCNEHKYRLERSSKENFKIKSLLEHDHANEPGSYESCQEYLIQSFTEEWIWASIQIVCIKVGFDSIIEHESVVGDTKEIWLIDEIDDDLLYISSIEFCIYSQIEDYVVRFQRTSQKSFLTVKFPGIVVTILRTLN